MRLETIPLILGILVALVGLGLLADAWIPEDVPLYGRERRRSSREGRHLGGESAIGIGVLCMAAALIGRDSWAYGTVAMIAGGALLLIGIWLNRRFLRERITSRGALRRRETREPARQEPRDPRAPPPPAEPPRPRNRIR